MYSQHFGLQRDPFSIAPDPRYLFMSERHREALAHLLYGVSGRQSVTSGTGGGFVLLTGDIGTGKTTICRCFLERIPSGCHVAYIFNPKLSVSELLQTVCEEFHIALAATASPPPTVKDYIDALNGFLLQCHAQGESCVLIIDEAQNLQPDVLEQLRLLTNLETSERKLLQIVLIGQPELRTMLQRPELEQLAQRVIARFHLDALSEAETLQYISHRLAVAGHTGVLPFDRPALRNIYRLTHGVPRRINLLCGRALLGAWAHGLERVTPAVVKRAAAEVFGSPTVPSTAGRSISMAQWVGGVGLLVGALFVGVAASRFYSPQPAPGPRLTSQMPPPVAKVIQTPSSAPVAVAVPARVVEPMDTLLPQLPGDITAAWNELAPSWQLPANDGKPCEAAAARQWACYQTGNFTVPLLRQLGRPGILSLRTEAGAVVYAVLVGLTDQTATLRIAQVRHTVPLTALVRLWQGDFSTYWRAPQGYSPTLRGGSSPEVFQGLASQLAQLDGTSSPNPAPQSLDPALRERVRDFQRAHGLRPDGLPGPLTLMQLESATGTATARLTTD